MRKPDFTVNLTEKQLHLLQHLLHEFLQVTRDNAKWGIASRAYDRLIDAEKMQTPKKFV